MTAIVLAASSDSPAKKTLLTALASTMSARGPYAASTCALDWKTSSSCTPTPAQVEIRPGRLRIGQLPASSMTTSSAGSKATFCLPTRA